MEDTQLMDKRSYFIGDRVAISQALCLLFSGTITYLIETFSLLDFFINLMWWILFIPIIVIIAMAKKKESLYFNQHWLSSFMGFLLIWSSFTIYLGLLIDWFVGPGNAFIVSLFMMGMYLVGYFFARFLRMMRHGFSKGVNIGIALLFSTLLITFAIIWGVIVFNHGLTAAGLDAFDYEEILLNQTCRLGIYILIMGIGIVISLAINYFMLFCLFDPKGLDVEEDPPNELYLKIMIASVVITFISWILLLVLFPPLAGGGGGGKSKSRKSSSSSSSSSTHYHRTYYYSRYRTYQHYGTKNPRGVYPPEVVEKEWEEHDLGR